MAQQASKIKVLVLGASENPDRYSNRAVKLLRHHHFEVAALGNKEGKIDDVIVHKTPLSFENIHTVTMYLGAQNQKTYYDYILSLHPKRVIFNPGAENNELKTLLEKNKIESVEACTLVMLNVGTFLD